MRLYDTRRRVEWRKKREQGREKSQEWPRDGEAELQSRKDKDKDREQEPENKSEEHVAPEG